MTVGARLRVPETTFLRFVGFREMVAFVPLLLSFSLCGKSAPAVSSVSSLESTATAVWSFVRANLLTTVSLETIFVHFPCFTPRLSPLCRVGSPAGGLPFRCPSGASLGASDSSSLGRINGSSLVDTEGPS